MVTSYDDSRKIIDILLTYLPLEDSLSMMEDVWNDVGKATDNESLEETIIIFKRFLEAEWEYSLPTQKDTLFQEVRS